MRKTPYSFSVLRYVHDPVTQEFANVGVAVYSKQVRYLNALCTFNYGRITNMFGGIDGNRFRQTARYIQDRLLSLGEELSGNLPFEGSKSLEGILAMVLPPDDSAFQFSHAGTGVSDNLDKTLTTLFARFVERYSVHLDSTPRDDDEIWRIYRTPLERRHVTQYLIPKKIVAPNYEYEFQHSWKNEAWRVYEPVSFDLLDATSILDKANRWVGRATSLSDSSEKFRMYFLLGEPSRPALKTAYTKAQNILHKTPGNPEFIKETEAEQFADDLAHEIKEHGREF